MQNKTSKCKYDYAKMSVRNKSFKKIGKSIVWDCTDFYIYLHLIFHGLIPRQRNSSREPVYAKYRWLHMNYSIEFTLCEKKFRLTSESKSVLLTTTKAKKVRELKRISHAQPSVFRINSFSRRISLA